ncbi:M23 family metallopeptidase [Jeotgalibacillus sp. ET6]|uniref:M23 family metallopeptidase n=1 Tax=Jeotgalibacillus sp. ET6 TaxID=3037260 RepID=UPI002418275D|nr:M23 family metallopeptidase [Jeotgalibacillus sp. ET6]MDG5471205.1 M23 family metallopeptidase [Jeotgalibacillus sp. ET6]
MSQGDKNNSTLKSNLKGFMKKRWSLPVLYLACAAVVVSTVFVLQSPGDKEVATVTEEFSTNQNRTDWVQESDGEVTEVNQPTEKMAMPVVDPSAITIHRSFYDQDASAEEQQESLVVVNQSYSTNLGIDIVQDGKEFDVTAASSGEVTLVQEDPFVGNLVEIEHADGLVTKYSAIKDISVQVGDQVKQAQPIAKAGVSELNTEAGTHLHFEVYKDGVAVNPVSFAE